MLLRQLFGQAKQPLAPGHLGKHVLRPDAGLGPEHDQIVEQIGAFATSIASSASFLAILARPDRISLAVRDRFGSALLASITC